MKACEFWHYLQVFNWIIIGYRAYKRWQGGSITQFHSISKSNYTEPVCRSIISSIRICLGFIYIYMVYIELILILAILLCGRELSGCQDAAMHLSDQWHGVCHALIPAGGAPGRLTCLLTILQRFVTYK